MFTIKRKKKMKKASILLLIKQTNKQSKMEHK